MSSEPDTIDLKNRLALSIAEAAQVVGLSENAFRGVLPNIERIQVGRRVLISVRALEAWLEAQARRNSAKDNELVTEMLRAVR
jgi:hypothetical protein